MAANTKHPPGPPMHQALIDVSDCPDHVEVCWFQQRAKCGKCGERRVDVRPNWEEMPAMPTKLRFD